MLWLLEKSYLLAVAVEVFCISPQMASSAHMDDVSPSISSNSRLICDKEISTCQQRMDSFTASFRRSLDSIQARAQASVQNQVKLAKMKAKLREAEDEFVKVLAVKTRKEAKQMAARDSLSVITARIEEFKRTLQLQRARRDCHAEIVSQESLALAISEEKASQDTESKAETQDCILWYNRVLGLQIEGGHGVRFTFTNINPQNPKEEYFFTVRHANDTYTLLDCDPQLNDIKELIQELNSTNGLFRFVRIMREKFQEVAEHGLRAQTCQQDISTISLSAPVFLIYSDKSTSPAERSECQIPCGSNRQLKKVNHERGATSAILSPGSISSLWQSLRFKVKK